jgi:recombination protein RecR
LPVKRLIGFFERLPGIGPKSAARLVFYLLLTPKGFLAEFAQAITDLKEKVVVCQSCFNIDEENPCWICRDTTRDKSLICVVEKPLDIIAIEKTGQYHGLYHVLGGVINPLEHIGPEQLHIAPLLERVKGDEGIKEVVIAVNPTMEGEATALYLKKQLQGKRPDLLITRIGHGLPFGADLDYADPGTLTAALKGRRSL